MAPGSVPNLKQAVPFFMVTDMARSLEFYARGLGFEIKLDWRPQGSIEWCWLERGGAALMLQEYREGTVPPDRLGVGFTVYFICADALALYHEFRQNGLEPHEPFVGNNQWVVGLDDPDGYRVFFESPTDEPEETRYSDYVKQRENKKA